MNILVSACLLGCPCRYDGTGQAHPDVLALAKRHHLVPVCPEQLGGLATPRAPAERRDGRVVTQDGSDVTEAYQRGGEAASTLAQLLGCEYAILKERSPSCGHGVIYDGTFSHTRIPGDGVTAALLEQQGLRVLGETQAHLLTRVLETERLILREMTPEDFPALCAILQDPEVMYAYEHAFSDEEAWDWLRRQMARCRQHDYGLWAVVSKDTGKMIGQCGLTWQDSLIPGKQVLEVGYLFQKAYWHQGYATEAAIACKQYAFDGLGADEVWSFIRDTNLSSQAVARRNGMEIRGTLVKHYMGIDMPHLAFSVRKISLSFGHAAKGFSKQNNKKFWRIAPPSNFPELFHALFFVLRPKMHLAKASLLSNLFSAKSR